MGEIEAQFDPGQFKALMAAAKQFDPELQKELRKELRSIGKEMAQAIQDRILEDPPSGGNSPGDHRSREQIAAGVSQKIATSNKAEGLFITTSSANLPEKRKPFMRAFNKPSFRHPIFGRDVFVQQEGRPFFGGTIAEKQPELEAAVLAALNAAVQKMGD